MFTYATRLWSDLLLAGADLRARARAEVVESIPCHMTFSGKKAAFRCNPWRDMALGVTGLAAGGWYLRSSAQYVTYRIEAHDPVSGLIVDSLVELHGVEIGNVARIELTDSRTGGIWLHIAKDAPISRAMVATITARPRATRFHRVRLCRLGRYRHQVWSADWAPIGTRAHLEPAGINDAAVRRPRGLGAKPVLMVGALLVRFTGSVGR